MDVVFIHFTKQRSRRERKNEEDIEKWRSREKREGVREGVRGREIQRGGGRER